MNRAVWPFALLLILCNSVFCSPIENQAAEGIIRGRITNGQNQPLSRASIYLFKESIPNGYNPKEVRTAISDSTGGYEFSNVQEGNYWIGVRPAEALDPKEPDMMFYFPDKLTMKDTHMLRVGPKAVLTGIDVRCVPGRVGFEAKGQVLEIGSLKPVANMQLIFGQIGYGSGRLGVWTDENGFFVIKRMDPGKYWAAIYHQQSEDFHSYPIYFDIVDADLSDLRVLISKGPSLSGKVVLNKSIPTTLFSEMKVSFHPNGISEVNRHPSNYAIDNALEKMSPVAPDGSFIIKGLPLLTGSLSLRRKSNLPLNEKYAITIDQNGVDLTKPFKVENKDFNGIIVHVEQGNGIIKGRITATNSGVDLKRVGIIITMQGQPKVALFRKPQLDENGQFVADGLISGNYNVMATIYENGLVRRTGDVQVVRLRQDETKQIEIFVGN